MIFGINITRDISKLSQITYNNFEISLVVFMPNTTTKHAITYTNLLLIDIWHTWSEVAPLWPISFSKELILILLGLFQSNAPFIQRLYLLFRANAGCFFRKALKSLFGLIYPLQQFDGIQLNNILKTLNSNTFKGNESVVFCNQYCPKYRLK